MRENERERGGLGGGGRGEVRGSQTELLRCFRLKMDTGHYANVMQMHADVCATVRNGC